MADIVRLMVTDHERIRRLMGALEDAARYDSAKPADPRVLGPAWDKLTECFELHARAEEEICFLVLFGQGPDAARQRHETIADHGDIREAVAETRLRMPGSALWWRAAAVAVRGIGDHVTGGEHRALSVLSRSAAPAVRDTLARQWIAFVAARIRDTAPRQRDTWSGSRVGARPGLAGPFLSGAAALAAAKRREGCGTGCVSRVGR